ncbi:NAD(P)H:quinone oxidoreductase [Phytoactinopolyspora mesophila]|uniref:NAD(P)H:quinone oxidoreductase n=1 Tax=Phytoactinopolyspora mesophila TaxID=2650750 RepID=A0A7K3M3V3_9ACTN|nr:NAD(P)H:quinone oxidoreductase [Phytoactinopolyspora mesophila]NDL57925.1 NAD(P)H:quinone oxidoreductase [Phytoactinopolyspora mesophila]
MTVPQARIAIVYYSSTGNVYRLAQAFADGAADAGADVRLRRVPELAPDAAVDSNPDWRSHLDATAHIQLVTLDDLKWANGYAFGTPTRYGNVSAQLRQFFDTTGGLWEAGELANKPATGFTSSFFPHGGQESTLISLYKTMCHWGSIVVPTGYVDYEIAAAAGGNPYGVSFVEEQADDDAHVKAVLEAARNQGRRLAEAAVMLGALSNRDVA